MSPPPADRHEEEVPWWQTRAGSIGALVAALLIVALLGAFLAGRVGGALSDVGRDADGDDPWVDPIGIEAGRGNLLVGRIPACAAGPVTTIALWDQDSRPIWQVNGPPTAMSAFIIGAAPAGFQETTPYEEPADGTLIRVVVNRRLAGVAGVRFTRDDVERGKVTSYYEGDYHTFSRSGFQGADICRRPGSSTNLLPDGQSEDDGA